MHTYLAIPVSVIPQWTKDNIPTYPLGYFSNDNAYMLIDNAHPVVTYQKWLGPNFDQLGNIISSSTIYTHEQMQELRADPLSIWYKES